MGDVTKQMKMGSVHGMSRLPPKVHVKLCSRDILAEIALRIRRPQLWDCNITRPQSDSLLMEESGAQCASSQLIRQPRAHGWLHKDHDNPMLSHLTLLAHLRCVGLVNQLLA